MGRRSRIEWKDAGGVVLAAAAVALAARISAPIPASPVPQSAQTLAVLATGILLGSRLGALALVTYLGAGALGLPVFADGAAGARHLVGPTAGYLFGFVLAAGFAGWWVERGGARRFPEALAGMLGAHTLILALGWARLAPLVGAAEALWGGVAPFLAGAGLKSALAALLAWWVGLRRSADR